MNAQATGQTPVAPPMPKKRSVYHAPRIEDYGAVNELTRSGAPNTFYDGLAGYTSIQPQ